MIIYNLKITPISVPYLYKSFTDDDLIFLVMDVKITQNRKILKIKRPLFIDGNSYFSSESFQKKQIKDPIEKYKIFLEKILKNELELSSDMINSPGLRYTYRSLKRNFICVQIIEDDEILYLCSKIFDRLFKEDYEDNNQLWILYFFDTFDPTDFFDPTDLPVRVTQNF